MSTPFLWGELMTVESIYGTIVARTIENMMFHDQASQIYCLLDLYENESFHKGEYYAEAKIYKNVCDYYIMHYGKILKQKRVKDPNIIKPYIYLRNSESISTNFRIDTAIDIYNKWADWRQETKRIYERMYRELMVIGEVASANELAGHISVG